MASPAFGNTYTGFGARTTTFRALHREVHG